MSLIKSFLCCTLLLLFVESAKAQDDRVRVGFGVGFGKDMGIIFIGENFEPLSPVLPVDFANFSVIILSKNFRFEPTFGYYSYSHTSSSGSESSSSNFRLGAVLAYANSKASMNYYYGIDIGAILSSQSSSSTDRSKTDFYIGPAIGGEYMFSDNFSLGGEIQVNYIKLGNFDEDSDASTSLVSTRGKIILRWYVN